MVRKCFIREDCECCLDDKMTRLPFPKQAGEQSKVTLDLVHTDLCGALRSIYQDRIQEFVHMGETCFGSTPAIIRLDLGEEYKSKWLGRVYREKRNTFQYTAANIPQQNGIAEHKNRTLVKVARCMLLDAGKEIRFRAEAINFVIFL